jgi:hypothetical protein
VLYVDFSEEVLIEILYALLVSPILVTCSVHCNTYQDGVAVRLQTRFRHVPIPNIGLYIGYRKLFPLFDSLSLCKYQNSTSSKSRKKHLPVRHLPVILTDTVYILGPWQRHKTYIVTFHYRSACNSKSVRLRNDLWFSKLRKLQVRGRIPSNNCSIDKETEYGEINMAISCHSTCLTLWLGECKISDLYGQICTIFLFILVVCDAAYKRKDLRLVYSEKTTV